MISAGNDGDTPEGNNPDPFALAPEQSFPGMVIIAGSVGVGNDLGGVNVSQISTFSNRAGTGQQYYLIAQGYRDRAPDETGTEFLWSGTSFSAPTIAGAVALLAQAFPNLSGPQIVNILLRARTTSERRAPIQSTAAGGSTSPRPSSRSARPAWRAADRGKHLLERRHALGRR